MITNAGCLPRFCSVLLAKVQTWNVLHILETNKSLKRTLVKVCKLNMTILPKFFTFSHGKVYHSIWDNVFKNEPKKICGRQRL